MRTKISTIEQAFAILEHKTKSIPYAAIRYLCDHEPDEKITARALYHLSKGYSKKLYYSKEPKYSYATPLWFAIVSEKHHDERFVELVIGLMNSHITRCLFELWEQLNFLISIFIEKYPEIAIQKIFDTIDSVKDGKRQNAILFLFEVIPFVDKKKYEKRILNILTNDEVMWYSYISRGMAVMKFEKAIPFIGAKLGKVLGTEEYIKHDYFYEEMEHALIELQYRKIFNAELLPLHKSRGDWYVYYKTQGNRFGDIIGKYEFRDPGSK